MKKCFIIIFAAFFLLPGIFCVKAQTSGTDTVNVSALVPEWPSGGVLPNPDLIFPIISNIEVTDLNLTSARIKWTTSELAVPQINYGKTTDYAKTYIGDSFSIDNSILLENLSPSTMYHFEIIAIDRSGNRTVSGDLTFETLSPFDVIPPANIGNFTAKSFDGKIILNWENPQSADFAGVQINKSIGSPALDTQSGEVIYSGAGESFDDANIENGARYFYTAFSYDSAGNFSSGAIASAIGIKIAIPPAQPPIIPEPPVIPPEIFPSDVENLEAIPDSKNKEIEIKWDNPDNEDFEEVEIYRSKDFPAMAPGEGEIVYKGKESGFKDKNIKEEEVYYYTAFTKDKSGNYSAGKTITGTLKKLPISPIESISMDDINFIFSEEALILPQRDDRKIYAFPKKEINIYYDSKNLPETLKTIIVTIGRSPYILSLDNDNKFYRAKFISPGAAGNYPMTISVLDFKHGKIFQARGEMVVEEYGKVYEYQASSIKYQALSIFDKEEILNLGKIGVEGAKVFLYEFSEENNNWQLWPAEKYNQENPQFTDKDGKFGFMIPNGRYKIAVEKDRYDFYSEAVEVENNLVNGEIEIERKFDWRIPLIVLAVLVAGYVVWRKMKRRRKMKLDLR